jgi:dihydroflavonol-4-reductase
VTAPRPTFLVTGATGFLGRHVLEAIRADQSGARLIVLVRSEESWTSQPWTSALGPVDVLVGELLDTGSWEDDDRLAGLTGIFHLAAEVRHSRRGVDGMIRTNVGGVTSILRVAARYGARVVFASTSGTVGCSADPSYAPAESAPYCEEAVARWPYYASKITAEREATKVAAQLGVELVIMRPPVLLGPGDHRFRSTSNVLRLLRGKLPFLFAGSIHFVDIRDVAAAMVQAMLHPRPSTVYHLPGHVTSLDAFFREVAKAADLEPSWRTVPAPLVRWLSRFADAIGIRPHFLPDPVLMEMASRHWGLSSRISGSELGFDPRPSEVTIRDTVDWLRGAYPGLSVAGPGAPPPRVKRP